MTDITETTLPGVGLRHDFATKGGGRVGVVSHASGRRDLVIYSADDPDLASATAELTEEEGRTLAELLGGSRIVERLEELPHDIYGLSIDWLPVPVGSPAAGHTIGELRVRQQTGASIVGIVRPAGSVPAPGPDDRVDAGDTIVVVGTRDAVGAVGALVEGSSAG